MTARMFYNPACSTCRNALQILRDRGVEPDIVEYLATPPTADEIRDVLRMLGAGPRAILREKEPVYAELGLDDPSIDDEALIDAMAKHPILIQRPIVVSDGRAVVGRPAEKVLDVVEAQAES